MVIVRLEEVSLLLSRVYTQILGLNIYIDLPKLERIVYIKGILDTLALQGDKNNYSKSATNEYPAFKNKLIMRSFFIITFLLSRLTSSYFHTM